MGFGLPAAIGAKMGAPDRTVCMYSGDGGFQMTIQELGTIMQEQIGVKMIILNNHFLGMVRQWQEMFFDKRYSFTEMQNPDLLPLPKLIASMEQKFTNARNWMRQLLICLRMTNLTCWW